MIPTKEKIIISLKISFLLALPLFITSVFLMMDDIGRVIVGLGTIIGDFTIAWFLFNSLRDNEVAIDSELFTFNDWRNAAVTACIIVQGGFSVLFLIGDIFKATGVNVLWMLIMFTCPEALVYAILNIPRIIDFLLDGKKKEFILEGKGTSTEAQLKNIEKNEIVNSEPVKNYNLSTEENSVPLRKRRD